MNQTHCPNEDAVAIAARSGQWESLPESLAVHAASCEVCMESARAVRFMQALAQVHLPDEKVAEDLAVPDARLVWWKAQLIEQHVKAHRRRTLAEWVHVAPLAAVSMGLATWIVWNWYPIEAAAAQTLADITPRVAAVAGYAIASLVPAALTLAALSVAPILTRE